MISVQTDDFIVQTAYEKLLDHEGQAGAIVSFVGKVRDFQTDEKHAEFYLEHYPGMTEKTLRDIEQEAHKRWTLSKSLIIHRVGKLTVNDQIVFVGVASKHRKDAFLACEFIIDVLKTQAPFWKKEGDNWVQANADDQLSYQRWQQEAQP